MGIFPSESPLNDIVKGIEGNIRRDHQIPADGFSLQLSVSVQDIQRLIIQFIIHFQMEPPYVHGLKGKPFPGKFFQFMYVPAIQTSGAESQKIFQSPDRLLLFLRLYRQGPEGPEGLHTLFFQLSPLPVTFLQLIGHVILDKIMKVFPGDAGRTGIILFV